MTVHICDATHWCMWHSHTWHDSLMYVRWFIHISCMIIYSDDSVCKMIYSHIMTRLTHVCEMIYIHIVHDDLFRWFNMWDDLFTYHAVISCMIWLTMVCEMTHLTEPVCPLTNFFCRGMTLLYKGMGLLCRDTELLRGDIWLFCREIGLFSRQLLAACRRTVTWRSSRQI